MMLILSDLTVQQNDGNDESDTTPLTAIEERLTFHVKMIEADIQKLTIIFSLTIILFILNFYFKFFFYLFSK